MIKIVATNITSNIKHKARGLTRGLLLTVISICFLASCESLNPALLGEASLTALQAVTLTDSQVKELSRQAAVQQDAKNSVAPASHADTQRLNRLVARHLNEDGLALNYKVYLSDNVNAFAMADGTIRVYSGLMKSMSDHELLFVIGHEIGHVKKGHSRKAAQLAYAASAARKGVAAVGGTIGALAQSQLGEISETIVKAQFSQHEEKEADDYGLAFMRRNGYPETAAISALRKLGHSGGGLFATHPNPQDRADRLEGK